MGVTPSWGSTTGTVPSHLCRQVTFTVLVIQLLCALTQGHLYSLPWSLQSFFPTILISENSEMSSMACKDHMAASIVQSALDQNRS